MTVIAWDGKTLAADKRVGYGNMHRTTTKIRRVGDALVGCSGSGSLAVAAMHLGKSAREAVEIACLYDMNCGNGIDTLELAE